jgi:hypothetical protein
MIRCTLELLPGGIDDPELNEHLGTIEIANNIVTSIETPRLGTYDFMLFKKRKRNPFWRGQTRAFPRYSYHPWNLVREILNQVADENGGPI